MRKTRLLKHFLLLCALIAGSTSVWAEEPELTLDFTSAWTAGEDNSDGEKVFTTTVDETTYTISGNGNTNFKFNSGYFFFGKSGAYVNLPIVDFDVKKIEVVGRSGASGDVKHNIFVGDEAVSTEVKGLNGTTSTFVIASDYQAAGTQYTLMVTSSHNAQVTYIKYYKKTSGGDEPTTYTITFDSGDGTFVGNTDFPNASNTKEAGTYTLPSATPASGYTFDGCVTTDNETPQTGSYTVSGDVDFTAHYTQNSSDPNPTYTYNFAGANNFYTDADLSTHPSYGSSNNVSTIYYGDGSVFVASGTSRYFSAASSGYFMLGKSGAKIDLPKFEGYKIKQVTLHSSTGHSTSVAVSIVSGSNTASAAQTWSTKDKDYVYDIASDYQSSALSVKVTNAYNTQFTSITIVCEEDVPSTDPQIVVNSTTVNLAYDATSGEILFSIVNPVEGTSVSAGIINPTFISNVDVTNVSGNDYKVTFNTSENTGAERTETILITYGELASKEVTVTQAAAPATLQTIAEVRAQGTGNVKTQGIVTSCVGTTAYIQDATAAICVYGTALTFGDEITVEGTLSTFNGLLEITSPTVTVVSSGNTVEPEIMTIAAINTDYAGNNTKQGWLVKIEDAKVTAVSGQNTTVVQGENTIVVRGIASTIEYAVGDVLTLTGNIGCYNAAQIVNPTDVTVKEVASITVNPTSIEAPAAETDGIITVTYNNITEVTAEVYFCDADGEAATYEWIEAEIDDDNNVYYVVYENTGEARTAYMKVYTIDDDGNDVYSDLITITQAKYVEATTYSLVTSVTPGKHYIIASGTDGNIYVMGAQKSTNRNAVAITANNGTIAVTPDKQVCEFLIEEDYLDFYTIYDASYNENAGGYLYAAGGTGSNHLKTQTTNNQNGEWTISIDDEGVATIKANMTGRNWMRFNNGNSKLFSCYTDGQQDIYLFERDNDDSPEQTTIAVAPAHEYITFCSTKALDFAHVEGLEAYIVTKVNETSVSTSKVEAAVPARTGLVLKKTVNTASFAVPVVYEATAPEGNLLTGVTEPTLIGNTAATDYILFDGKFYPANQGTLPAGKAYLRVEEGNAPELGLDFSGETTGIVNVNRETITNNQYYTLDGRRVENPTNGIYIINGRKVVVK